MKRSHRSLTALILLACLTAQLFCPVSVRAASDMTAGDAALDLIRRYEGFHEAAYEENGKWYVGYGTQIEEGAWPDGVTEEQALSLVREELRSTESSLSGWLSREGVAVTQAQFDALLDFTYTLGSSWMNGTSLLRRLARGEVTLSRRETMRAFGVWCHAGGKVLPSLAQRRLEEAALWLDGDTAGAESFRWLALTKEAGVRYATDFAVYERGGAYDAFPTMFRLGWTPVALKTVDGKTIRLGDTVTDNVSGSIVWERNRYDGAFDDVPERGWFYDYVMELTTAQVINGRGDGTYAPQLPTTTGEALKLILLAAGHPEQEASGEHWASGYADYALERGWITAAQAEDLNAPIRRLDVARFSARALGFGQSFAATPFADADDGFLTALYEIGVLEGEIADGELCFFSDRSLTRAEISAIVWRLRRASALGTRQTVSYGNRTIEIAPEAAHNAYDRNGFSGSGKKMSYTEEGVTALRGIDVSRWSETIDWDAVAADGVEFAILRVGGRYQMSGEIYDDKYFEDYYKGARAAGLKLGVYFYSQAITVKEAEREADYVLGKLKGKQIDAPVVFDWETAESSSARTNGLPVSVVCNCAVAFCGRVKAAGYEPMIYMNTYDGYVKYDVSRLSDYQIWYAGQYGGAYPRFVYDFVMWQYTDQGVVDGIDGKVDMDLWFLR